MALADREVNDAVRLGTPGSHGITSAAAWEALGLIFAFRLSDLRACEPEWAGAELAEPLWLHFNLTDSRAREWLRNRAELPEEARELLLGSDPRVHLEVVEGGFAAVLGDLFHDFDDDPERLGVLRVYVNQRLLITGRSHPLMTLDVMRRELTRRTEPLSPLEAFQSLVERLADTVARVVERSSAQLDDAEDRILEGKYRGEGTPLGKLRRLLVRLRRLVGANRAAVAALPTALAGLYATAERDQLRAAVERLEGVGQDLEAVQEKARLLQEEISARLGEDTNRNLFVLSIVTTTLLPITLITGIWGMNVGGLPFSQSPHGFEAVMLGITGAVLLALWLLRRSGAL